MKVWKRLGAAVLSVLTLAALTGTALATEPLIAPAPASAISVQMNGEPLAFSDAAPEASNGRTFVPLYAVTEALGAEVSYDVPTRTITIQNKGAVLTMVLGEDKATVVEDGETRTIQMDVTPYAKNNRTYVPIAFVADALGCGVGWDQSTRTVVVVDVDALLGDATFDLMDNFAAYCNKQSNQKNMTVTGTMALEMKDKTGEIKPINVKGGLDGVTSDTKAQLNWNLKLDDPSKLLGDSASSPAIQGIIAALSDLKGEIRMDMESGAVYLTMPAALAGSTQDAWYSLDLSAYEAELLSGMNMAQLTQLQDAGIREVLSAIIQSMPLTDSQTSYAGVAEVVSIYKAMLSDQAFTQKGSAYVSEMKLEDIVDMTVTLTKKGDDIVAADIKMNCDVTEDGDKVAMTMTEHAAPDKVTVKMEMSMDVEGMAVKFNLDLSCLPTSKTPVTTLPAGVQAIPMN